MRTRTLVLITLLLLVFSVWPLVAARAQVKSDDPELAKFQGTWVLVSGEMSGQKIGDEQVKQGKITFKGDKVELVSPHQHNDVITATIVKLDTTKNPGQMHWVRSSGPNPGVTVMAIYKFEGPDMYSICFHPAGASVPEAFCTTEQSGHIRHTWLRVKQ